MVRNKTAHLENYEHEQMDEFLNDPSLNKELPDI